ncbi:MAG: ABC transporter ATP-binding protein [Propionibacteriaceae bacterium]
MLLEVDAVNKTFDGRFGRVHAVRDASLNLDAGQCLGIIGESGSGKSTLAGIIAGLIHADSGTVTLDGATLESRSRSKVRAHQRRLQVIFQEPRSSFDPRMSIGACLREPLSYKRHIPRADQTELAVGALESVGLTGDLLDRPIRSISVGQAQRVAIARALLAEPKLIICDEITSALDVTVQADILDLLRQLRAQRQLSLLFVSHDIAVVASLADHVAVMRSGCIVEQGSTSQIVHEPAHEYTQLLISMA